MNQLSLSKYWDDQLQKGLLTLPQNIKYHCWHTLYLSELSFTHVRTGHILEYYWATTINLYLLNIIQSHIRVEMIRNNQKNKPTKGTMPSKVTEADNYTPHMVSVKQ